jgi:hypothetical protein
VRGLQEAKGVTCPQCHYQNLPGRRQCRGCRHRLARSGGQIRLTLNRLLEVAVVIVGMLLGFILIFGNVRESTPYREAPPTAPPTSAIAFSIAAVSPVPSSNVIQNPPTPIPPTITPLPPTMPPLSPTPVPTATAIPRDTSLTGQMRYIANTESQGVRVRATCNDAGGEKGWNEGTVVVIEYGTAPCAGWLLVSANDERSSWVRVGFLSDDPPRTPPTPRPASRALPEPARVVQPTPFAVAPVVEEDAEIEAVPLAPTAAPTAAPLIVVPTLIQPPTLEPTPEPPAAILPTPAPAPTITSLPRGYIYCNDGTAIRDQGRSPCNGHGGKR